MVNEEMLSKKDVIVATVWDYLLSKGLSGATICGLCKEKKLAQSSLYYWFENKDDIWITAGKYGLSQVVEKLFVFTLNHINDVKGYFATLLSEVDKYKAELGCVVEITVSPIYSARMRKSMMSFNDFYSNFAEKLMELSGCTFEQAEIFIYTVLSAVIDYVVWEDGAKTQLLLDNLCVRTLNILEGAK